MFRLIRRLGENRPALLAAASPVTSATRNRAGQLSVPFEDLMMPSIDAEMKRLDDILGHSAPATEAKPAELPNETAPGWLESPGSPSSQGVQVQEISSEEFEQFLSFFASHAGG